MKIFPRHAYAVSTLLIAGMISACTAIAQEFQVSPTGKQLADVLHTIREMRRDGQISSNTPVKIILHDGTYPLTEPIRFSVEDSGTEATPLIIEAAPGEHPILSGGVEISNWTKTVGKIPGLPEMAEGKIWMADAPKVGWWSTLNFRELWVNGRQAIRAREPNDQMARLAAWDKTNETAVIPAPELMGIEKPTDVEMVIDQVWEIAVLRIKSLHIEGTNAFVTFRQPESKIEFAHPWPPVIVNTNYRAPFFVENAIQFLNSPGEWFEDMRAGKIYYWPREGEDMTQAKVIAPALETLVQIGGSLDKPVSHIQFTGVTFAYTTWLRPSKEGHVPLQAGMYLLDAHKLVPKGTPYHRKLDNVAWIGRPPAAVSVRSADHISFQYCIFESTASAGLDLQNGTHDSLVQGCIFRDIGGNGIQLGEFSDPKTETHFPWNPTDEREICSDEIIANNLVTHCAQEDWGCEGIAAGYVRDTKIEHNEVSELPYTGISVGWGWTKMTNAMRSNLIFANHVFRVGQRLGDLGGIYALSAQPGTVIAENVVDEMKPSQYVPDPEHWFYIYLDEGSSFITVRDNWCPLERFLRNANGPGYVWTNNGPQVSQTIKNAAGLEPTFRNLLSTPSP
ncbi:MAG TPA: right-handed parallel beta-helix repeat-containing protein [Pseudomonadales bacterium]|nr:right-handed parallel beta-helix repeat-containing protein [Pseudomonadales bacterium]